jgi:hypothetical protein
MQAKIEYKMKEREMLNASKSWNFNIENTEVGRVRIKLQRLMQRKMDGNPTFRARVDIFQEALKEGKLKSVFNDKKEKAKERERIQLKRLNKRQQADDEPLTEKEEDAKLKLDLGIEAEDTKTEKPSLESGSKRGNSRPSSERERLTGKSESSSSNKNTIRVSQSPKNTRPNSAHPALSTRPGSSTRPRSSNQRGARNSGGGSSRPSSSNVNTGRTSVDTARTDSKTVSSHLNTDRKNGSNGNDWKPLNF